MKILLKILIIPVLMLVIGGCNFVFAATTATQTITFSISAVNNIVVSGDPGAMNISKVSADGGNISIVDSSTTYSMVTNESNKKITAMINSSMPKGVSLKVKLDPPDGATSLGDVVLTSASSDVVTGITKVAANNKTVTYILTADPSAGIVESDSRIVTLTLTGGS